MLSACADVSYPRERCPSVPQTAAAIWRALIVHPTRERAVLSRLDEYAIPAYLPISTERPLIPGYVFAQFEGINRAWVYSRSPYIVRALEFAGHLGTVTAEEIAWLRQLCESGVSLMVGPPVRVGDPAEVISGPFRGIRGRVNEFRGEHRLSIELPGIMQYVHVLVTRDQVRRA